MRQEWVTRALGEVCDFQRGLTYAKSDEVASSSNIVLRANNVSLTTNLLDFSELKYINDNVPVPESKKIKKHSILICTASGSKSHLGKIAYIDDDYDYAFGGFMGLLTANNNLLPKYLFYCMISPNYKNFISALSDGTNINNLKFANLQNFMIPIPPLPEQKRIVKILDEAFAGIATAKANTEKNLENARALFESYLNGVFAGRGKGWETAHLSDICQFSNGLWKGKKPPFVNVGVIRNTNFQKDGTLNDSNIAYLDVEERQFLKRRLKFGDIILEKSGGGPKQAVGRVILFDKQNEYFSFSNFTSALRVFDPDYLDFRFLHKFLFWTHLSGKTEQMQNRSTGIRNLNFSAYKSIPVPVPPLSEQKQTVTVIDCLQSEIQRLESIYQQKLDKLEALKQSLLHQAFSGDL